MSKLVKRLRGQRLDGRSTDETMLEAADELDRLNAQALELCAEISGLRRENERLRDQIDTLKARSLALFWRLPDETIAADLRAEAAVAFNALRQHAIERAADHPSPAP